MSRIGEPLRRLVRGRAGGRCEYCFLPDVVAETPFHIDHVRARQHRGETAASNLAYSCGWCNLHKGTNLSAVDPESGRVVRLFNPRVDRWKSHFRWEGPSLTGLTAKGRATTNLLDPNATALVDARAALIENGEF